MKFVFVGSSKIGLQHAEMISDLLKQLPNTIPRLWPDVFPPGALTLEAIENMMHNVSGAVLLATPDDERLMSTGSKAKVPRDNVIFELGLLSARLGRPSIALCKWADVELPTDLKSFNYIDMGEYKPVTPNEKLPPDVVKSLVSWCAGLTDTGNDTPRTRVLHGYSGRWEMMIEFRKWRGYTVRPGEKIVVHGCIDLTLPIEGRTENAGAAYGTLTLEIQHDRQTNIGPLDAAIRVVDRITVVRCSSDGSLYFESEPFSRFIERHEGNPVADSNKAILPGPKRLFWRLRLDESTPRKLVGHYGIHGDERDDAKVELWR